MELERVLESADLASAQQAASLLGLQDPVPAQEWPLVLEALHTPLDQQLPWETAVPIVSAVAVTVRQLRRAWEPWLHKYEQFRDNPRLAREDAAQVAAELRLSPFTLLRDRALEADPQCWPRSQQVTSRYLRKPGRHLPQPDIDVRLEARQGVSRLPSRVGAGPVGLWQIQTANGYIDLPPLSQVFTASSKMRFDLFGQPCVLDAVTSSVEVAGDTSLRAMAQTGGDWWMKPTDGGSWKMFDPDGSAVLSTAMRGKTCRFAHGPELLEADLMKDQVRNLRTGQIMKLFEGTHRGEWKWQLPAQHKKEKEKGAKGGDDKGGDDDKVDVPEDVATLLESLSQQDTLVQWHEREDSHVSWEADISLLTAKRIVGKATSSGRERETQTFKIQPPF